MRIESPPPTQRSPGNRGDDASKGDRFVNLEAVKALAGSAAKKDDILDDISTNTVPEITHNVTGAVDVDVVDSEGYTDVNSTELLENTPISQLVDTIRTEKLPVTIPRPGEDDADSFINTQRM